MISTALRSLRRERLARMEQAVRYSPGALPNHPAERAVAARKGLLRRCAAPLAQSIAKALHTPHMGPTS